jgi:TatD DNase family protein
MELVDTHCHIQSAGQMGGEPETRQLWAKDTSLNGDQLVADAIESGVSKVLCVGCDLADSKLAIDFVAGQSAAWASIGIHPHEANNYVGDQQKLTDFSALATQPKVVAIGECGLDYFYGHSSKQHQLTMLEFQIQLAQQHNLPLIFHVREAFSDFWPLFERLQVTGPIRGVLHSFTDSQENLERALACNLYIGVNGIATFAKSDELRALYRAIPLDRLLLETDSPFLTPVPYRGTINKPKYVRTVAKFLAKLRAESIDDVAAATTTNACQLFGV